MRFIVCVLAAFVSLTSLTGERMHAQTPSPSRSLRNVILVGNSVNGTVTVLDDDGSTFKNLGTISVIPDLPRRMIEMDLLFWRRLIYARVKHEELIAHKEPDRGNRFVDDLFLSPDGTKLFVSRGNLADVVAFDLASLETSAKNPRLLWRHRVFAHADHATMSPDGTRIVVSVSARSEAEVLDTRTGTRVGAFETGPFPHQNDYSSDGVRIYNGNLGDLDRAFDDPRKGPFVLTVADAGTYHVDQRIMFPAGLRPMVLTDAGRTLFMQLSYINGVMKYDLPPATKAGAPAVEIPRLTGEFDEPDADIDVVYKSKTEYPHNSAHHGLAISGDMSTLCDCGTIDDTVSLVKTAEMSGITLKNVGSTPYWATTSTDGGHCLVSLSGDDSIAVIDYKTQAVQHVALATPAGAAVTQRKNKPYFPQRSRTGQIQQTILDRLFR